MIASGPAGRCSGLARFSAIADVPEYGETAVLVDLTPRTRPTRWPTLAPAPGRDSEGISPVTGPCRLATTRR
jgi:hypothetical protein